MFYENCNDKFRPTEKNIKTKYKYNCSHLKYDGEESSAIAKRWVQTGYTIKLKEDKIKWLNTSKTKNHKR